MLVNPELERIAIGQIGGGDAPADSVQQPIRVDEREVIVIDVLEGEAVDRISRKAARLADVLGHFVEGHLAAGIHVRVIGHGGKTAEAEKKEYRNDRGENHAQRGGDHYFNQRKCRLAIFSRHIFEVQIAQRKWWPAACEGLCRFSR